MSKDRMSAIHKLHNKIIPEATKKCQIKKLIRPFTVKVTGDYLHQPHMRIENGFNPLTLICHAPFGKTKLVLENKL